MIRDFIGAYIQSGALFDGTYGLEIETESYDKYSKPRLSVHHETGDQLLGKNGKPINDMSFWDLKKDGSLRNYGVEYVLKVPLMYEGELLQALAEFENKTQHIAFIQDSISTSVHIHINILPETWRTFANLLTIYTLTENLLIEFSGPNRRNNLFCLPIRSVPSVVDLMTQMFSNIAKGNYLFGHKLSPDAIKYAALNLSTIYKFGSIEFRSFRGVTDVDTIFSWVSIFQKMLEYARRDITPYQIMDLYEHKNDKLFEDIFQGHWSVLKHENQEELLKPNLWYAGTFGYLMSIEGWNKIDTLPVKNPVMPTTMLTKKKAYHTLNSLDYLTPFNPVPSPLETTQPAPLSEEEETMLANLFEEDEHEEEEPF